jgi:Mpv17 / PMP22 family
VSLVIVHCSSFSLVIHHCRLKSHLFKKNLIVLVCEEEEEDKKKESIMVAMSLQKPSRWSLMAILISFLIATLCPPWTIEGLETRAKKTLSATTTATMKTAAAAGSGTSSTSLNANSAGAAVAMAAAATTARAGRFATVIHLMPHYECAAAAVMSGLGDILAQLMIRRKRSALQQPLPFDYKRTVQFMMKGVGEGFLWTLWYRWADRSCVDVTRFLAGEQLAASPLIMKILGTVVAIVMDLCLACPFIYSCWDIPFPAWMRGTPVRKLPHKIREKLPEMLLASIKVWTPVNVLIYNAPVQYRPYIMSVADVFWQSIVSSIVISAAVVAGVSTTGGEGGLEVVPLTTPMDESELKQHL